MISIKKIREKPELIAKKLSSKNDSTDISHLLKIDNKYTIKGNLHVL